MVAERWLHFEPNTRSNSKGIHKALTQSWLVVLSAAFGTMTELAEVLAKLTEGQQTMHQAYLTMQQQMVEQMKGQERIVERLTAQNERAKQEGDARIAAIVDAMTRNTRGEKQRSPANYSGNEAEWKSWAFKFETWVGNYFEDADNAFKLALGYEDKVIEKDLLGHGPLAGIMDLEQLNSFIWSSLHDVAGTG